MCAARVELPDLAAIAQPQQQQDNNDKSNKNNNNKPLLVYLSRSRNDYNNNKNNNANNNNNNNTKQNYFSTVSLDQAFATFTSELEKEYKELDVEFAEKEAKKTDEEKQKEKAQLEAANAQKQKQGNANNKKRNFQRKEDSVSFQKYNRLQSFYLRFASLQPIEEFLVRHSPCDEFMKKSIVIPIGHSSATKFAYALCLCPATFTFMSKNFDFKFDLLTVRRSKCKPDQVRAFAVARFHSVDDLWRCYQMFEHRYEAHPILNGQFFGKRLVFKNEVVYPSHHSNNNNNNGDEATANAGDADLSAVSGEKVVFAFDDHKTRSKEQAYSCFVNPKNKDEVILRAFYACALPKETDLKLSVKNLASASETPELDFISGLCSVPEENLLLETYHKQFSTASNRFDRKFADRYSFSNFHRQATAAEQKEAKKPNNRPAVVFETAFNAKSFEEIVASRRFYYQEDVVMTHELSFEEQERFKDAKIILSNAKTSSAEVANQHLQKFTSLAPALIETLNLIWDISLKNSEDDVATPHRPTKLFTAYNHLGVEIGHRNPSELLLRDRFNLPIPETNYAKHLAEVVSSTASKNAENEAKEEATPSSKKTSAKSENISSLAVVASPSDANFNNSPLNIVPAGARSFGCIADEFAERALTEIIGAALKVVPARMTVVNQKYQQASAKLWNSVVSNEAIFNLFGADDKELLKKAIEMASGSNGDKKQGAVSANAGGISHIVAECFARSLNRSDNLSKERFYKLLNFAGIITDDVVAALVETDDTGMSSSRIKALIPYEVYRNAKEENAKVQLLRNKKRVDFQKKSRPHPFTTAEQMEIYMGKDTTSPTFQLTRDQIEGFKKIAATNTFASDVLKPLKSFEKNADLGATSSSSSDSFKHLANQLEIHAGLRSHFSTLSQAIVLTLINRSGKAAAGSSAKSLEVAKFVADHATKKISPFSEKEQEAFVRHVAACFEKYKDAKKEEQKRDNLLASATIGLLHPSSVSLASFDQYLRGFVINTTVANTASDNNEENKLLRVYVPEVKQIYEYPLTSWTEVNKFANFTLGSEIQVQFSFGPLRHEIQSIENFSNSKEQQQQQQQQQQKQDSSKTKNGNDDDDDDDEANANAETASNHNHDSAADDDDDDQDQDQDKTKLASAAFLANIRPEWKTIPGDVSSSTSTNTNKFRVSDPKSRHYRDATFAVLITPPCHRCLAHRFMPQMTEAIRQHYGMFLGENFCGVARHENLGPGQDSLAAAVVSARMERSQMNNHNHNNNHNNHHNNNNNQQQNQNGYQQHHHNNNRNFNNNGNNNNNNRGNNQQQQQQNNFNNNNQQQQQYPRNNNNNNNNNNGFVSVVVGHHHNNNNVNYQNNHQRYQNNNNFNNNNNNNNNQGRQFNNNNNNNNYNNNYNGQQRNNNNNNGNQNYNNNNNYNNQRSNNYNNNYQNNGGNNNMQQQQQNNNNNNINRRQYNNNNNNNNMNQQNNNNNGNVVRMTNNQQAAAGLFAWGQVAYGN